jgi:hypothetical protein
MHLMSAPRTIVNGEQDQQVARVPLGISRENVFAAYAKMDEVYHDCVALATSADLTKDILYSKLTILRNYLMLKLEPRVIIHMQFDDGTSQVYRGVKRIQPVAQLLTHTIQHNSIMDISCMPVFTLDSGKRIHLDSAASVTWDTLMSSSASELTVYYHSV